VPPPYSLWGNSGGVADVDGRNLSLCFAIREGRSVDLV
jgi:hypothetical protein